MTEGRGGLRAAAERVSYQEAMKRSLVSKIFQTVLINVEQV